jgi:transcriptional regulator with XRE-family HTH domain
MKFSTLVRSRRLAQGLIIKSLAERAGVHPSYISLVEHGKKNPRIGNAIRIAKALNINVGELSKVDERFKKSGVVKKLYG